MRLVNIEIDGYRRFRESVTLQVDSKLVALLGPNEAGKTTILRALLALNDDAPMSMHGPSQDVSRGVSLQANHSIIKARFLLEDSDHEAIADIEEAASVRWLVLNKSVGGRRTVGVEPFARRNISLRHALLEKLETLISEWRDSPDKTTDDDSPTALDTLDTLIEEIPDRSVDTLSKVAINMLGQLEGNLRDEQEEELAEDVSRLLEQESREAPATVAARILEKRRPRFVLFDEESRTLTSTHDISLPYRDKSPAPLSVALVNLAETAGLDLRELYDAVQKSDRGRVHTMLNRANATLQEKMSASWSQSGVHVSIDLDATTLTVLAGVETLGWENLSERSDGLRQFVALLALLSQDEVPNGDIILLIDEIEMHLHYDAQADLIQMLGKQQLARQVIYTTHSFGCLPEDLGAGIRFVQPSTDGTMSRIANRFWSDGVGLSPILFGMGATTMAFLPVRYCVLTEGPVDMLLLPALLREATGRETLGYQVSPGLSSCDSEKVSLIQNDGARVVFLTDGDGGGRSLARKLKKADVPENRIIRLDDVAGTEVVIEDFVLKKLYAEAVNSELERSGQECRIDVSELSLSLRPKMVEEWCDNLGIPVPKKVNVAYRILERPSGELLVEPEYVDSLCKLDERIRAALRVNETAHSSVAEASANGSSSE